MSVTARRRLRIKIGAGNLLVVLGTFNRRAVKNKTNFGTRDQGPISSFLLHRIMASDIILSKTYRDERI